MNKIRAIIIDPNNKTITEQMIDPNLSEFYRIIECEYIEMFTSAPILAQTDHFLYIDEDGMRKENTGLFMIDGYFQPIKGKALLMKSDPPEEVSATLSLAQVEQVITFAITI